MSPERRFPAEVAGGFSAAAGHYSRARPTYPRAAIGLLKEHLRPGPVLDVAAGTGILTGQMARAGMEVWAAELSVPMLEQFSLAQPPGRLRSPAVACAAESLPFVDASFFAITVAQAFHWFDPAAALEEFARVLGRDGILALVWNLRDEEVGWVRDLTDLVEDRSGGRPVDDAAVDAALEAIRLEGSFVATHQESVWNPQVMDLDLLGSRIRSTSFVAGMEPGEQSSLVEAAQLLVGGSIGVSRSDRFEFPHICRVQLFVRS